MRGCTAFSYVEPSCIPPEGQNKWEEVVERDPRLKSVPKSASAWSEMGAVSLNTEGRWCPSLTSVTMAHRKEAWYRNRSFPVEKLGHAEELVCSHAGVSEWSWTPHGVNLNWFGRRFVHPLDEPGGTAVQATVKARGVKCTMQAVSRPAAQS